MILVTKLDGNSVLLNVDNVKYIEDGADTIVHHTNGDTLIVKEKFEEMQSLILDYQKKVFEK